jgi:hypothetical protein
MTLSSNAWPLRRSCAVLVAAVLALPLGVSACRKSTTADPPPAPSLLAAVSAPAAASAAPAEEEHGRRRGARTDVNVRIDGREVAVLRYGELPPRVTKSPAQDDPTPRYFRVADYLRALGVEIADLRAVHFGGNRGRVASIEGFELQQDETRFVFDFTQGEGGVPAVMWSPKGLSNPKHIDFIRSIDVYVTKDAPLLNRDLGCYAAADEGCASAPTQESPRGVRVYVDGRLVGRLRRKALADAAGAAASIPLSRALASADIPMPKAFALDLVDEDEVVERSVASAAVLGERVTVAPRAGEHGALVVTVPASATAPGQRRALTATALLFYSRVTPPRRAPASNHALAQR